MDAIVQFLDGLPEIEPSGWASMTDDMKTGTPTPAQGSVSHTDKPEGSGTVSMGTTTNFETVWVRSALRPNPVPSSHERRLRPRRPKPASARQKLVVLKFNPKSTPKRTGRNNSKRKGRDNKADTAVLTNSLLVNLRVPPLKHRKVETPSSASRRRKISQVAPSVPLLEEIIVKLPSSPPSRSPRLDGVSPKTLQPAVTTSKCPQVVTPPTPSPAKKRRIKGPTPTITTLGVGVGPRESSWTSTSWSEIYPLLPSSSFGSHHIIRQHNLWTEKDEQLLRGPSWSPADELTLVNTVHPSEVLVAYAIKHLYSCRLQDLFRYGLRRPLHPTPSFWTSLLHLLPHPYFNSSIALLRYALQSAILYRFPMGTHTAPLMPPYSGSEPGFITHLRELQSRDPLGSSSWERKAREIVQVAEFRCRAQIHKHITSGLSHTGGQDKHDLASILAYRAPTDPAVIPTELGNSVVERHLFFLTQKDVDIMADCLDEIEIRDRIIHEAKIEPCGPAGHTLISPCTTEPKDWDDLTQTGHFSSQKECLGTKPTTVMSIFNKYWTDVLPESKGSTEACRQEYLVERRLEILAERREAIIRSRIDAFWGWPPQQFDPRHSTPIHDVELLDVPPFDPDPDFSRFEGFVDEANLRVIRGNWMTPATKAWFWEHGARFSSGST